MLILSIGKGRDAESNVAATATGLGTSSSSKDAENVTMLIWVMIALAIIIGIVLILYSWHTVRSEKLSLRDALDNNSMGPIADAVAEIVMTKSQLKARKSMLKDAEAYPEYAKRFSSEKDGTK